MRQFSWVPILLLLVVAGGTPLAAASAQGLPDGVRVAQDYGAYDDPAFGPAGLGPVPLPAGLGRGPGGFPPLLVPPSPCIRPIIIQVGRGLINKARTRIVYGARPPCG